MKNGFKHGDQKRKSVCFEPMGPVAEMLRLALLGKRRGTRTRIIEDAIAEKYREKYPKVYEKYSVLRQEAA